jgi:hypothetical protein
MYEFAKEAYAKIGIDTDAVIERMKRFLFQFSAGRAMMLRALKARVP